MTGRDTPSPVLSVRGLTIAFGARTIVRDVDLDLHAGEVLGIVGTSGAGKSVLSRSLAGLAGDGARVRAERFAVRVGPDARGGEPVDLARAGERQWQRIRGGAVGLVLQDALVALDPLRTVGRELDEAMGAPRLLDGRRETRAERRARAVSLLERVGLADAESFLDRRADQLSGGQRQRALIATAIARDPRILIADEPTASLDPDTRDDVLDLFAELAASGMAIVFVSHDLHAVERIASTTRVLRYGELCDAAEADTWLRAERGRPADAPERIARVAHASSAGVRGAVASVVPALTARGVSKSFAGRDGRRVDAVVDADLDIAPGETVGLVGASGSGKSTLGRLVLGLTEPDAGHIDLFGARWAPRRERVARDAQGAVRGRRGLVGVVPQDALSSFDPRRTVRAILTDALTDGRSRSSRRVDGELRSALDEVGLPHDALDVRPLRLSGGQRQRVAIARALAAEPGLLVCDEAVSALDPRTRDSVLDLLERVREQRGLAMLFISHDPLVTARMSHRVLRMTEGRLAPDD